MRVAIAGYGIEGQQSYEYWNALGDEVTILDEAEELHEAPGGALVKRGSGVFDDLSSYDLVIRTASLAPKRLESAKRIWSATNEFFLKCPAQIIAVTGTKGKGTTASLIASILSAAGRNVHVVGNIGIPALAVLPSIKSDDLVVFEVSSFQLWDLEASPKVAVVLRVEPEHLDVHADMDDYVAAKTNIVKYQSPSDVVVYHPTNSDSAKIAHQSLGAQYRYGTPEDGMAYEKDGTFFYHNEPVCSTDVLQIPGPHNVENSCAAISVAMLLGCSSTAVQEGLRSFKGLPHRVSFVRELDGVKYYDDSYSSASAATLAAVDSFSEKEIVIIGGYDRGLGYTRFAQDIATRNNIRRLLIIGQTRHAIADAFEKAGVTNYTVVDTTVFAEIINLARSAAQAGDVLIFSPGCASFDMFKNFTDRGEQFIKIVEGL